MARPENARLISLLFLGWCVRHRFFTGSVLFMPLRSRKDSKVMAENWFWGLLVAVLTAVAPLCGRAADPAPAAWTTEHMLRLKLVGEPTVSPDGRRVAFVVGVPLLEGEHSEWLSQIHVAAADGTSSMQLTRSDKSATSPEWSPDGQWIAFLSPRSGPKTNIWRIRVDGGEAEQLTDEKGGVTAFRWSPDGASIAFLMPDSRPESEERAEREKRDAYVINEAHRLARLYIVGTTANGEGSRHVRRLTDADFHVGSLLGGSSFDWSPDSRRIVFTHQPTPLVDDWPASDISMVDVATAAVTSLATTKAAETQPHFSSDGSFVVYSASEIPPRWAFSSRLQVVGLDGKNSRPLAETFDLKPTIVGFSADGKNVLVSETQRTLNRLFALPLDGQPPVELSAPGVMVSQPVLNLRRDVVAFIGEQPGKPPEVFMTPAARFDPKQVSRVQDFQQPPLGKTEVVRWRSTDGREIEGLLTYPVGYTPGQRVPLLVIVHGGPTGVFVQSSVISRSPYPIPVFSARGYAVLRCNVRGSSGYGKEFRFANHADWGGGDFRDLMTGVDSLIEAGLADPERLGIMGWSYGGFMTSWAITQTQRFRAASVGAGVTNLVSFTGTSDISNFIPDYMGAEFWNAFDVWKAHSPVLQAKGVTTPTLIQHGDKDLRVPITQGYELYNALKRQSVPVKMVVYPRQAHAIQEPKLLLDAMQRNVEWFDQWLGSPGS
jgi:dipeptidyl aminopeptidase/acylaminoacyl peptidase